MDQERLDQEAKQNEDILKALSEADKALDIAQKQKDLTTEERLANELKKSGRVTVLNLDTRVTNLGEIKIPEPLKEIKVSNLGEIKLPEINVPEYPTSMNIENWSEMPMQKFPDHIGIRKPAWLPLLFTPLKPIKEVLDEISAKLEFKPEQKQKIEFPTSDEDAIAVRVINPQPQMIGGGFSGGGSSMPKTRDDAGKEYGLVTSGIKLPVYDYVSMALSVGDTTETWTFREGGASGSTVAQIKIVYTDSGRTVISTVTRT
jgi:hypothetical protein